MSVAALRAQMQDRWMLSLAPRLPSRLPWPIAYAAYRTLARSPGLFAEAVETALAVAPVHVPIGNAAAFCHDLRTLWLLEAADLYLSRRRPVTWLPSWVSITGTWPSRPFIALTFHYGTGLWLCRALRNAGHRSTFLSARFERDEFAQRPWRHDYGLRRLAEVERIGGQPIAYRPGVRLQLLDALQRGSPVIGLVDIPPRLAAKGQQPVQLLGQTASLPDGLLRLAAEARVPIVPCWVAVDFASGRRTVVIGEARSPEPFGTALAHLADTLDRLVRAAPAAWMFWPEWHGWLQDANRMAVDETFSIEGAGVTLRTSRL